MTTSARRPDAALANPEHARPCRARVMRVFVEDLDREAEPGQARRLLGKCLRVDAFGRLGDQITGEEDRLGGGAEGAISLFCGARRVGRDGDRGERRLLLGFLRRAVFVKAVGAQLRRRRRDGPQPLPASSSAASPGSSAKVASLSPAPLRWATRAPPRSCEQPGIQRIGLAEAGDDDAAELAGWADR